MTWTYNESELTNRDKVRGLIGDVNSSDQLLADETVNALLTANGDSILLTARAAIKRILTKFNRTDVDVTFGPSSVSGSQRQAGLRAILKDIERDMALGTSPFAGGISKANKETYVSDTDRTLPAFTTVTHSHPGSDDRLSDFPDD
jgi:hypothetical protein